MSEQERLQVLMAEEGLNAKEFAKEVGISAATMSNVINGRNKPSLEVMQKVLARFRTVSPQWLILGNGSMYTEISNSQGDKSGQNFELTGGSSMTSGANNNAPTSGKTDHAASKPDVQPKEVVRVLVFYSDGTFDELLK